MFKVDVCIYILNLAGKLCTCIYGQQYVWIVNGELTIHIATIVCARCVNVLVGIVAELELRNLTFKLDGRELSVTKYHIGRSIQGKCANLGVAKNLSEGEIRSLEMRINLLAAIFACNTDGTASTCGYVLIKRYRRLSAVGSTVESHIAKCHYL